MENVKNSVAIKETGIPRYSTASGKQTLSTQSPIKTTIKLIETRINVTDVTNTTGNQPIAEEMPKKYAEGVTDINIELRDDLEKKLSSIMNKGEERRRRQKGTKPKSCTPLGSKKKLYRDSLHILL